MPNSGVSVVFFFFFFPFFLFLSFISVVFLGAGFERQPLCVESGWRPEPTQLCCRLYRWEEAVKGLRYFPSKKRGKTKQSKTKSKGKKLLAGCHPEWPRCSPALWT